LERQLTQPPYLRTVIIIDYQNLNLTSAQLFAESKPIHKSLIEPHRFSMELIAKRNALQKSGYPPAIVTKILVYRGLPSLEHDSKNYARNLAQKANWERDPLTEVVYRPLKYPYLRDLDGARIKDKNGKNLVGKPEEKGIDVLCALALVRETQNANIDLVILASQDTDLVPALNEAITYGSAKIETCSWYSSENRSSREIRPEGSAIWNTRLNQNHFSNSLDRKVYP
jgi:hypothetical protein